MNRVFLYNVFNFKHGIFLYWIIAYGSSHGRENTTCSLANSLFEKLHFPDTLAKIKAMTGLSTGQWSKSVGGKCGHKISCATSVLTTSSVQPSAEWKCEVSCSKNKKLKMQQQSMKPNIGFSKWGMGGWYGSCAMKPALAALQLLSSVTLASDPGNCVWDWGLLRC